MSKSVGTEVLNDLRKLHVQQVRAGRLRTTIVAVGVTTSLFLAGCSSSNSSTGSSIASSSTAGPSSSSAAAPATMSPAASAELCAARDQLRGSLTALVSPNLVTGGTVAIKSAVDNVQTSLKAVGTAAKQDYRPQVSAVQSALADLQSAVAGLGGGAGSVAGLKAVVADIRTVGTETAALMNQLTSRCGS